MIYEDIKNFTRQFTWEPVLQNAVPLSPKKIVVVGMGGSALAAGLLKVWKPELNLVIHRNYGLPRIDDEEKKDNLVILSSYSGNTEEVIDAFNEAGERGLARAVITTGGKLLEQANEKKVPTVILPKNDRQPRLAVGFSFLALLQLVGENTADVAALSSLDPTEYEEEGKFLAQKLIGFVPIVYASVGNTELAYAWKVVFNETGKIPAFWNVLPELNHNEMIGFDVQASTQPLQKNFYFLILEDSDDDPRILKRAQILKNLYRERNLNVQFLTLAGQSRLEKIFISYLIANWTAFYLAETYGVEPEVVPMVEEFKKLTK